MQSCRYTSVTLGHRAETQTHAHVICCAMLRLPQLQLWTWLLCQHVGQCCISAMFVSQTYTQAVLQCTELQKTYNALHFKILPNQCYWVPVWQLQKVDTFPLDWQWPSMAWQVWASTQKNIQQMIQTFSLGLFWRVPASLEENGDSGLVAHISGENLDMTCKAVAL